MMSPKHIEENKFNEVNEANKVSEAEKKVAKVATKTSTTKSKTASKTATKTASKTATKTAAKTTKATTKKSKAATVKGKKLVIVESPSKAKTIGKFLGSDYKVVASVGHVRDLPKSQIGIDIENDFEPKYINIRGKGDIIKALKKEAKVASKIYLATDPDREGEAISWHLAHILEIDRNEECRIVFNEITKDAVKNASKAPRRIDASLVDAQQARRVLDRLVGYKISPLLWKKVKTGLSAGRVQSAALKIICDREKEILKFVPEEYWDIMGIFDNPKKGGKPKTFEAKLATANGKKIKINNKEEADNILVELKAGNYTVSDATKKDRKRKAYAPFTTSSLQQDASIKLNFNPRKTMKVAQELYEGISIPKRGTVGLITYLRTDSVRISAEAKASAKEYIIDKLGKEYASDNFYSSKKKDIQDAHEAIRPSYIDIDPELIKSSLTNDQYKLYKLIWTRFLASQMAPAVYDAISANIDNGKYTFRATGASLKFDGFLRIYDSYQEDEGKMPLLENGEELTGSEVKGNQHFTTPPPRFNEASLIKYLEENDIGRPSTYAPIVSTLVDRKYIKREKKNLIPTELGFIVTDVMEDYFKEIVDASFTAEMERGLDKIEEENTEWKEIIRNFYVIFEKELKRAEEEIEKIEIPVVLTDELCELCGKPMAIKEGRFGKFLACSAYPECKNTKPIIKKIGVNCPKCGKEIVQRKGKSRGKIFYGCSGYPDCNQVYWDKPIQKECPECGSLLVEKKGKETAIVCSNKECKYKE